MVIKLIKKLKFHLKDPVPQKILIKKKFQGYANFNFSNYFFLNFSVWGYINKKWLGIVAIERFTDLDKLNLVKFAYSFRLGLPYKIVSKLVKIYPKIIISLR